MGRIAEWTFPPPISSPLLSTTRKYSSHPKVPQQTQLLYNNKRYYRWRILCRETRRERWAGTFTALITDQHWYHSSRGPHFDSQKQKSGTYVVGLRHHNLSLQFLSVRPKKRASTDADCCKKARASVAWWFCSTCWQWQWYRKLEEWKTRWEEKLVNTEDGVKVSYLHVHFCTKSSGTTLRTSRSKCAVCAFMHKFSWCVRGCCRPKMLKMSLWGARWYLVCLLINDE